MKYLDISEVVSRSGMSASKLRYYEKLGLIRSIGRQGLRRQYAESILQTLSLIRLGQAAELSLEEIKSMFGTEGHLKIDRDKLVEKSEQLSQQIIRMQWVVETLNHVAQCPKDNHLECKEFQKLIKKVSLL